MRIFYVSLMISFILISCVLPVSASEIIEQLPDQLDIDAYLSLQQSDPGDLQQSDSGDLQQADPGDLQQSDSGDLQQADPGDLQQSDPGDLQQSDPGDLQQFESLFSVQGDSLDDSSPIIQKSLLTISASDTNGLKSIVLDLIGDYEPVVTIESYRRDNQSALTYITDISYDWPWLASAFIFSLVLYCVLKMIGGFLCNL